MTVAQDTSHEPLRFGMPTKRAVIAAVLTFGEELCLFRRSELVGSDRGLWHCITGYLHEADNPLDQALNEVEEEAGLSSASVELIDSNLFSLSDKDGHNWEIHTFHFKCNTNNVLLNWENDAYRWTPVDALTELEIVDWFSAVLASLPSIRPSLASAGANRLMQKSVNEPMN